MSHVNVKGFSTTHLTSFQILIFEIKYTHSFVLICRGSGALSQFSERRKKIKSLKFSKFLVSPTAHARIEGRTQSVLTPAGLVPQSVESKYIPQVPLC